MDHKSQLMALMGAALNLHVHYGPTDQEYGYFNWGLTFYRYDAKDHVVLKESIQPFDNRLSTAQNVGREGSTLPF